LEFITLTACRLSEVLYAEWNEIDFDNRVWVVPASRMKANKEHRVPLSDPTLALLNAMQVIRHSDYVFPGNRPGRPVGVVTPVRLAKQADGAGITGNVLRSTCGAWAAQGRTLPPDSC